MMRPSAFICTAVSLLSAFAGKLPAGTSDKHVETERIAGLIKQLGEDSFARREAASRELTAIGEPAVAPLRKVAATSNDAEIRRRAEQAVRDIAIAAKTELAKWSGAWEESRGTTLFINGDRWSWTAKGAKPTYANTIRIIAVQEKLTLADLLVGEEGPRKGKVVKAIFRLDGDTLHYCGTYDLPRPTAFVQGRGDPFCVEWKRIKGYVIPQTGVAVGMSAPEIESEGLDGKPFKLSDYRGKVVLLTFWGNWCPPCRAMYEQKRSLVANMADRPFAVVGVNSDRDRNALKAILAQERISWRSFWNGPGGTAGQISKAWNIRGWPTLFLIDQEGVIRNNWVGSPGRAIMEKAIDDLVKQAPSPGGGPKSTKPSGAPKKS
jgi:uncharacterized protein (TIGR03067 family)